MRCAGKIGPCNAPDVRATTSAPGARITTSLDLKRYRCKEQACKRTFNDLTGTLLDGSKRSLMHGMLATFLLCLSCSSRRIARELGVHVRTGYRWCWWLRNAALFYPYSDTCRTYSSITRVYGFVKNHSPSSQATGKPRLYVCKFVQHAKVTL
jgi:transposase-like protein